MKSSSDSEGVGRSGLTRRELLRAGAAAGLGVGLLGSGVVASGCGEGETAASASPSAAAGSVKPGGIFTLATDQLFPKDSLDPLTNITDGVDALEGMLREGLVTYDFTFTPQPRLAESWDVNADSTEYTFHLRPNVTWHDGTPFTAKDAEWSIQRILDPDSVSGLHDRLLSSVDPDGVQVIDDLTLKLALKRPDSLILHPLSNQQGYMTKADDKDFEAGIGTGPFKLKSWTPGTSYEVEKNTSYWLPDRPYLDGVRGVSIPEASTKLQAVATGQADVTQIAFDQLPVVKANAELQIDKYEKGIMYCAVMLTTAKPWTDGRVREAIKRSLDRDKVMQVAYAGEAFASPDSCVAMGDPYMDDALIARTTMDRAAAEKLMAEAGFPNGIDLELKYPGDPLHANFGLAVAAGLKGSPFRVTPKAVPADTYWDTIWMKDPFCVDDWNRRHPVETMNLQVKSDAPWNETQWKSPEMDALLDKALATPIGPEQDAITTEACLWQSQGAGNGDGGSGELIPAYLNRLWVSRVGTVVVPWTFSMIDFRQTGHGA
ncbi:MAG TPA: ABC transporter substrate-binding protein [Thermoleophilia bacterium]|nr:ABC transporter substrate-binding protein [Thermoleophilia bacterium]